MAAQISLTIRHAVITVIIKSELYPDKTCIAMLTSKSITKERGQVWENISILEMLN